MLRLKICHTSKKQVGEQSFGSVFQKCMGAKAPETAPRQGGARTAHAKWAPQLKEVSDYVSLSHSFAHVRICMHVKCACTNTYECIPKPP